MKLNGMAKEFSTVKEDFRLFSQMEKLWEKIYFGKPDTQMKKWALMKALVLSQPSVFNIVFSLKTFFTFQYI